jgi:hypothetical protein
VRKDFAQAVEHLEAELREVRTAVVDGGCVDRSQYPVGDVRGAGIWRK